MENDYIHNVEILIISNKKKYIIKELSVDWVHIDGSKINIFKDSFKMLLNSTYLNLNLDIIYNLFVISNLEFKKLFTIKV